MNTQDREVVKALLQSMTDTCLFHSDEFRAALKHFNITTTYTGQDVSDEAAFLLGKEHNHFVNVFRPSSIDTNPHGERYWFATKAEAEDLSDRESKSYDQPIEAAHTEALEMDAEFNFERISREINSPDHLPCEAETDQSRRETIRAVIARAIHVGANSFGDVIGEHEELVETLRNAGFIHAANRVDAVYDKLSGQPQKEKRKNWLELLRGVSASI